MISIAGLQVHSLPSAFGYHRWLYFYFILFFTYSDTLAHWHLNENIYTGFLPDDFGVGVGVKGKEINYI